MDTGSVSLGVAVGLALNIAATRGTKIDDGSVPVSTGDSASIVEALTLAQNLNDARSEIAVLTEANASLVAQLADTELNGISAEEYGRINEALQLSIQRIAFLNDYIFKEIDYDADDIINHNIPSSSFVNMRDGVFKAGVSDEWLYHSPNGDIRARNLHVIDADCAIRAWNSGDVSLLMPRSKSAIEDTVQYTLKPGGTVTFPYITDDARNGIVPADYTSVTSSSCISPMTTLADGECNAIGSALLIELAEDCTIHDLIANGQFVSAGWRYAVASRWGSAAPYVEWSSDTKPAPSWEFLIQVVPIRDNVIMVWTTHSDGNYYSGIPGVVGFQASADITVKIKSVNVVRNPFPLVTGSLTDNTLTHFGPHKESRHVYA